MSGAPQEEPPEAEELQLQAPRLRAQRNRRLALPELAWTLDQEAEEDADAEMDWSFELEEGRLEPLPALRMEVKTQGALTLFSLGKLGGERSFRLRARGGGRSWSPWSDWCSVDGGPANLVAVKVFPALLPLDATGWEKGAPQVGGLMLEPLDTLWLPSDVALGALAEAAADVCGLAGLPNDDWLERHRPEPGETTSAVVPGMPPSAQEAVLVVAYGTTLLQVPVVGLEPFQLGSFQPAMSNEELHVAVTGFSGLRELHCLAFTEGTGEMVEGPAVQLTRCAAPVDHDAFADYSWLDGAQVTHDAVLGAMLHGSRLPVLLAKEIASTA